MAKSLSIDEGDQSRELRDAVGSWEKKYQDRFKKERRPEEEFVDDSGIKINRLYTPLDLEAKGFDYMEALGLPGEYPYVRGITPGGYRERLWRVSHPSGYALPEDTNKLWKAAIQAGLNQCHIIYDLPTQLGLDPDHPRAEGEVGRVGVSLVSQRDWEVAFDGIDLSKIRVSQTAIAMGVIGIANYLCLAKKQGLDWRTLDSSCQNDILKDYVARGTYIFPPTPSVRLVIDCLGFCAEHAPRYQALQVCSVQYSESQMTPVHEAAFTLADAFCYLQAAVDRGIDIDRIAPGIEFLTQNEHYGFFQEIAKHRAIRKIYSKALKDRFGAKKPESMMCRFHIVQGGNSLQRQQYLNNIVRSAIAGLGAVMAGAQHVNLRTYDERFGIPTEEALITNVRLQHVLAQETGITDTVDPLAGSYFVEWLTCEFEEKINKELEDEMEVVTCDTNDRTRIRGRD